MYTCHFKTLSCASHLIQVVATAPEQFLWNNLPFPQANKALSHPQSPFPNKGPCGAFRLLAIRGKLSLCLALGCPTSPLTYMRSSCFQRKPFCPVYSRWGHPLTPRALWLLRSSSSQEKMDWFPQGNSYSHEVHNRLLAGALTSQENSQPQLPFVCRFCPRWLVCWAAAGEGRVLARSGAVLSSPCGIGAIDIVRIAGGEGIQCTGAH